MSMHKKNPAKLIQGCIFTIFILRSDADVKKKQKTFEVTFKFPKFEELLFFTSIFYAYQKLGKFVAHEIARLGLTLFHLEFFT